MDIRLITLLTICTFLTSSIVTAAPCQVEPCGGQVNIPKPMGKIKWWQHNWSTSKRGPGKPLGKGKGLINTDGLNNKERISALRLLKNSNKNTEHSMEKTARQAFPAKGEKRAAIHTRLQTAKLAAETSKEDKKIFLNYAKKNKLIDREYNGVCSAYVTDLKKNGQVKKAGPHWIKKSFKEFSKPKYTKAAKHLFGKSFNSHNCVKTYGGGFTGGMERNIKLKSLRK